MATLAAIGAVESMTTPLLANTEAAETLGNTLIWHVGGTRPLDDMRWSVEGGERMSRVGDHQTPEKVCLNCGTVRGAASDATLGVGAVSEKRLQLN